MYPRQWASRSPRVPPAATRSNPRRFPAASRPIFPLNSDGQFSRFREEIVRQAASIINTIFVPGAAKSYNGGQCPPPQALPVRERQQEFRSLSSSPVRPDPQGVRHPGIPGVSLKKAFVFSLAKSQQSYATHDQDGSANQARFPLHQSDEFAVGYLPAATPIFPGAGTGPGEKIVWGYRTGK